MSDVTVQCKHCNETFTAKTLWDANSLEVDHWQDCESYLKWKKENSK